MIEADFYNGAIGVDMSETEDKTKKPSWYIVALDQKIPVELLGSGLHGSNTATIKLDGQSMVVPEDEVFIDTENPPVLQRQSSSST